MNKTQLTALAVCVFVAVSANAQNLVVNGSFEEGTFTRGGDGCQKISVDSTNIFGWTVTNDEIAWCMDGNAYGITSSRGAMCLDLTGYTDSEPHGGVSQTITTKPGQVYQLSFDLGVIPDRPSSAGPIVVMACAGVSTNSFTHNPTGPGVQWGNYRFQFTAESNSTPITIAALTGGVFIGLDNVVLVPVPRLSLSTNLQLCWDTQTNGLYQVQWTSSLQPPDWQNLGLPLSGTETNVCVSVSPTAAGSRFFRIEVLP